MAANNKRYVATLESDVKMLQKEKGAAEAIAQLSEDQLKSAQKAKDELTIEAAKLQEPRRSVQLTHH